MHRKHVFLSNFLKLFTIGEQPFLSYLGPETKKCAVFPTENEDFCQIWQEKFKLPSTAIYLMRAKAL